jgi:hypothetical protein
MTKPLYQHDCQRCQYLGSDDTYDYYTCSQGSLNIRTYVARYSNVPWEYVSMPIDSLVGGYDSISDDDPTKEAYRRYKAILNSK